MSTQIQKERILAELRRAKGGEVPLYAIMCPPHSDGGSIAQYNARIFELRKEGHEITNRRRTINGVTCSWFRLEA